MVEDNKLNREAPDFSWKIILVGNKRVGKTSIANRYCKDTFDEDQQSSQNVQF
jgi:GTPase SAR1 family protein